MNNYEKTFSESGNKKKVVLINRLSDPAMWVLYVYKKFLFFKKNIETYWFTDKIEAEKFAELYVKNNA